MGLYDTERVVTQGGSRQTIQAGGPSYGNPLRFYGIDNAYFMLGDVTVPDSGGINPINIADPLRPKEYLQVASERSAPGFATGDLMVMDPIGGQVARLLNDGLCPLWIYDIYGLCAAPTDYHQGWDKIRVFADAERTQRTLAGGSLTADQARQHTVSLTYKGGVYTYAPLLMASGGAADITTPLADAVYWSTRDCGYCGPANSGVQWRYALAAAAAGAKPYVVYSLDGGLTTDTSAITAAANDDVAVAIRQVGSMLVVWLKTAAGVTAHYWATVGLSGIPSAWTKVTAGYVNTHPANDVAVLDSGAVIIVGDDGYMYRMTDTLAGVTPTSDGALTSANFTRIAARGPVVLIGDDAGGLYQSVDGAASFGILTGADADAVSALEVIDRYTFWVFTGAGAAYVTKTQAETWIDASAQFPDVDAFDDAQFVNAGTGYVTYRTAGGAARIATTFCGGEVWSISNQPNRRLALTPTHAASTRIAIPRTGSKDTDHNNVLFAGTAVGGTDGVWFSAAPSILG